MPYPSGALTPSERKADEEKRKKTGAAADAAADSQINQGDLGAAARKAKGQSQTPPASAPVTPGGAPEKPAAGATLQELIEYQRKLKEFKGRQSTGSMSAGSQASSMK